MNQHDSRVVVGGGRSLETLDEWSAGVAKHRHELIQPLIDKPQRTRANVEDRAHAIGVGVASPSRTR